MEKQKWGGKRRKKTQNRGEVKRNTERLSFGEGFSVLTKKKKIGGS